MSRSSLLQMYTLRLSFIDHYINKPIPYEVCEYLIFDSVNCPEHLKSSAIQEARDYRAKLSRITGNYVSFVDVSDLDEIEFNLKYTDIHDKDLKPTTRMNVQVRIPGIGEFISYSQVKQLGYDIVIDKLMELEGC